jgi:hypothetical protein
MDGVEFVIESFKEHLADPDRNEWIWNRPQDTDAWYVGCHHWEVYEDWDTAIKDYGLDVHDRTVVDLMGDWLTRRRQRLNEARAAQEASERNDT